MQNNDSLRSIRYILNANESKLVEICKLGGFTIAPSDMRCFLLGEEDGEFLPCNDEVMSHFLNGLVIFKRGKDETRPAAKLEVPVTNNTVLKKLRVAFELREDDLLTLIGVKIGKPELSSFLRSVGHRNYRECGDQVLRNLLRGLAQKFGSDNKR